MRGEEQTIPRPHTGHGYSRYHPEPTDLLVQDEI